MLLKAFTYGGSFLFCVLIRLGKVMIYMDGDASCCKFKSLYCEIKIVLDI
ncbi:hypothetical protein OSC52_00970 [Clostridium pasteurianum]|nr:hypothetical protein [Clostridium pasteurianum]UZW14447.1 hypothetical protein OSC52_00970 [Clostridium pasteurianum]